MTKQQIKAIQTRLASLAEELSDPLCLKFEAARKCVQEEIERERGKLSAA